MLVLPQEAVEEEGAFLPSGTEHIDKKGKKSALHTAAQYGQNEATCLHYRAPSFSCRGGTPPWMHNPSTR